MKHATKMIAIAALALSTLAGCGASSDSNAQANGEDTANQTEGPRDTAPTERETRLDVRFAPPMVGDVWVADLSHFSVAGFETEGNAATRAFGQMRVVGVTEDLVTLVTEDKAWPDSDSAKRELNQPDSRVAWDESEEIQVDRNMIAELIEGQKILASRR